MASKEKEETKSLEDTKPSLLYLFSSNENILKYYQHPDFLAQVPNPHGIDLLSGVVSYEEWSVLSDYWKRPLELTKKEEKERRRLYLRNCFLRVPGGYTHIRAVHGADIIMHDFFLIEDKELVYRTIGVGTTDLAIPQALWKAPVEINQQTYRYPYDLSFFERLRILTPGDEMNFNYTDEILNLKILSLPEGFRVPSLHFIGPKVINGRETNALDDVFSLAIDIKKHIILYSKDTHARLARLLLSQMNNVRILPGRFQIDNAKAYHALRNNKAPILIQECVGDVDRHTADGNLYSRRGGIHIGLDVIETGMSLKRISRDSGYEIIPYQEPVMPCCPVLITYQPAPSN